MGIRTCQLCKKPIGNSWTTFNCDNLMLFAHAHCTRRIGCSNCIKMILRGVEGKCICGRTIQLNVDGDNYRIIEDDDSQKRGLTK